MDLWNNHDRESFIACFAEDCEFSLRTWWDLNATALRCRPCPRQDAHDSGEIVVLEAVYERRTPD